MLDAQDIQTIKELIEDSENRTRDDIHAAENRWMAFYEASIQPQIQILAEGHQNILDTLAPKSRVDNLEDDVVFLKSIVKTLMQEVSDLKKAQ